MVLLLRDSEKAEILAGFRAIESSFATSHQNFRRCLQDLDYRIANLTNTTHLPPLSLPPQPTTPTIIATDSTSKVKLESLPSYDPLLDIQTPALCSPAPAPPWCLLVSCSGPIPWVFYRRAEITWIEEPPDFVLLYEDKETGISHLIPLLNEDHTSIQGIFSPASPARRALRAFREPVTPQALERVCLNYNRSARVSWFEIPGTDPEETFDMSFFSSLSFVVNPIRSTAVKLVSDRIVYSHEETKESLMGWLEEPVYWKRNNRWDHEFICQNALFKVFDRVKNGVLLVSDSGKLAQNQVSLMTDVILPYSHRIKLYKEDVGLEKLKSPLFLMGNQYRKKSATIRDLFFQVFQNEGVIIFTPGAQSLPGNSLIPACRLFDASVSLCVPVIVSHYIELPFEDIIYCRKIAILIDSTTTNKPKSSVKLMSKVTPEKILQFQMELLKVKLMSKVTKLRWMNGQSLRSLLPEDLDQLTKLISESWKGSLFCKFITPLNFFMADRTTLDIHHISLFLYVQRALSLVLFYRISEQPKFDGDDCAHILKASTSLGHSNNLYVACDVTLLSPTLTSCFQNKHTNFMSFSLQGGWNNFSTKSIPSIGRYLLVVKFVNYVFSGAPLYDDVTGLLVERGGWQVEHGWVDGNIVRIQEFLLKDSKFFPYQIPIPLFGVCAFVDNRESVEHNRVHNSFDVSVLFCVLGNMILSEACAAANNFTDFHSLCFLLPFFGLIRARIRDCLPNGHAIVLVQDEVSTLGPLSDLFGQLAALNNVTLQSANGLGLQDVRGKSHCDVSLQLTMDTAPKLKDPKTGELEGLSSNLILCEAVATWELVQNKTTILTLEYIDDLPTGWVFLKSKNSRVVDVPDSAIIDVDSKQMMLKTLQIAVSVPLLYLSNFQIHDWPELSTNRHAFMVVMMTRGYCLLGLANAMVKEGGPILGHSPNLTVQHLVHEYYPLRLTHMLQELRGSYHLEDKVNFEGERNDTTPDPRGDPSTAIVDSPAQYPAQSSETLDTSPKPDQGSNSNSHISTSTSQQKAAKWRDHIVG